MGLVGMLDLKMIRIKDHSHQDLDLIEFLKILPDLH